MKRMHIHVSVDNLVDSIRFYSGMFAAKPIVQKDDYAKWMLDDPRMNFAISQRGLNAGVDHLGIQVESAEELGDMHTRLAALQAPVEAQDNAACCYAKSDKYWINDPSGIAWETFHTLAQIPVYGEQERAATAEQSSACCVPLAKTESKSVCCVPTAKSSNEGACCP